MTFMNPSVRGNIWRLTAMSGIRGFLLIMPIIVLFFQENGLSMRDIFIVEAAFSVAIILFEIPSGYFADKLGKRFALLIGAVLTFVSYIMYSMATGFWPIFGAEVVMGIGYAFVSGADSALLYDSLVEMGEADTYKKREGRMLSVTTFAEAVASIFGGLLAAGALRAPVIAQACIVFFLIPLAYTLVEPRARASSEESKLWSMRRTVAYVLKHNAPLRWLIIYASTTGTAMFALVWLRQPYLDLAGVPIEYFGYIWAALMLTVSVSSLFASAVERRLGRRLSLVLLMVLAIPGSFILSAGISVWLIPAMFIPAIGRGFAGPIIKDYVQAHAVPEVRATILSIQGFFFRGMFVIVGPIIGWMVDVYSLQTALFLSSAALTLVATIFLLMLLRSERTASKASFGI